MPLKQPQPLYASIWGVCTPSPPALWCLPGLPGLAWPGCCPGPSPSPSLGPTAALLSCGGCHDAWLRAGAGPLPAYLLPALVLEQPGPPGLTGPPEGGGGGGGG